jgi:hypothetical protein
MLSVITEVCAPFKRRNASAINGSLTIIDGCNKTLDTIASIIRDIIVIANKRKEKVPEYSDTFKKGL